MKRKSWFVVLLLTISLMLCSTAFASFTNSEAHQKYLYPVVRITYGYIGGSGTVIYSQPIDTSGDYSTYILTNHHVVEDAISIEEEWNSDLQKQVKKEKRDIVYVEFFQYRELSVPIGTLKIEADIVLYNESEDMALVKTRSEDRADYVATLYPKGKEDDIHTFDETMAVGCALGWPPIPTPGILTRKGLQIDSYEYWTSTSQIIYGNSGGAMFLNSTGEFIGIPSKLAIVGWGTPITHMGVFIPIERIYEWLEKEHYDFIFDSTKTEKECLEIRKKELKGKRKEINE